MLANNSKRCILRAYPVACALITAFLSPFVEIKKKMTIENQRSVKIFSRGRGSVFSRTENASLFDSSTCVLYLLFSICSAPDIGPLVEGHALCHLGFVNLGIETSRSHGRREGILCMWVLGHAAPWALPP